MGHGLKIGDVIIVEHPTQDDSYLIALIEPPLRDDALMFFLRYYDPAARTWADAITRRRVRPMQIMGRLPPAADLSAVAARIDAAVATRTASIAEARQSFLNAVRAISVEQ